MAIRILCPGCRVPSSLPESRAGQAIRCPACGKVFRVGSSRQATDVSEEPIRNAGGPTFPVADAADLVSGRLRGTQEVSRPRKHGPWLLLTLVLFGFVGFFCLAGSFAGTWLWLTASRSSPGALTQPEAEKQANLQPPEKAQQAALAIHPPALAKDKVEKLVPGTIANVSVGGGGRFLVLHLPKQRKLGIFDVNEARITHYLSVADDQVHFAAGQSKLLVVLGNQNILQRWDLITGKREVAVPFPLGGVIKTLALGSASEGPLLVYWAVGTGALDRTSIDFLDIHTLNRLDLVKEGGGGGFHHCYRDFMHIRASAEGSVFGMWCTSHTPQGLNSLTLTGKQLEAHYDHTSVGHVVPGPQGKTLYTGSGPYTVQLKAMGNQRGLFCVPARHGRYYLSLTPRDRGRIPGIAPKPPGLALHLAGETRPLLTLADIQAPVLDERWTRTDFTMDKRIHLIPQAKLLVIIPGTNDRLILHRFDVQEALEKSGLDYLLVVSAPRTSARRGTTYRYAVRVKSKQGGVTYRLESGPAGMKVSPGGLLTWTVPGDFANVEATVILSVKDRSGQEIFHTFRVQINP
jgi:hypothetical protein